MSVHNWLRRIPLFICHKQGFLFFFNWRITALQRCVGFCHATAHISHESTHRPPLLASFPPTPHSALELSRGMGLGSLCYTADSHQPYISQVVCTPVLLCQLIPHAPSPAVSTSLFSTSASIPALQIHFSVHFSRFHVYAYIYI